MRYLNNSVIEEINELRIEPEYKEIYKTKFEEEFIKWSQNYGDVYNQSLRSQIPRIFNNEKNIIVNELKSNSNLTYQSFISMINKLKKRLNEMEVVIIANDKMNIMEINSLIKSKVRELDSPDLNNKFIKFVVCMPIQDKYFNQIKDTLRRVKISERNSVIQEHAAILGRRLEQAINNYYKTIGKPKEDKMALIPKCLAKFQRGSCDYYDRNFKSNHQMYLNLIENERNLIKHQVNDLIQKVCTYDSKIIDKFSDESKLAEKRFINEVGEDLYKIYADDFYKNVIISNYDLISTNAARSCIYSTGYYQCPDCGNIWETKIEVGNNNNSGCANFYCYGKGIGCNGRQLRTEMSQSNTNIKLARQLDIREVMNICDNQLNRIKEEAIGHLRWSLFRKY